MFPVTNQTQEQKADWLGTDFLRRLRKLAPPRYWPGRYSGVTSGNCTVDCCGAARCETMQCECELRSGKALFPDQSEYENLLNFNTVDNINWHWHLVSSPVTATYTWIHVTAVQR